MVSVFYFNGAKEKDGRSSGSALTEEDSFLWNQDEHYCDGGPHGFIKAEWNHTFTPNFFVSAQGLVLQHRASS